MLPAVLYVYNVRTRHNLLASDKCFHPFKVIPFLNGTLLTDHQHNLPPLVDVGVINALTGPQATAYLVGYDWYLILLQITEKPFVLQLAVLQKCDVPQFWSIKLKSNSIFI
ncbi:hypothetical protein L208DRAFT_1498028 [Tricholoma matsutake]|nr:hypothetical protein L208DRAFT_1498028 [Tricholoma matsutake 945]